MMSKMLGWIGGALALLWLALPARAEPALGEMALGAKDAPVTIIEYASMTCPHCAHFHETTLKQLKGAYIDSGKVRLVFREFPFDEAALRAAQLARCGGEDRYFAYLDVLFSQQRQWVNQDPRRSVENLAQIARLGGMSEADFRACLTNKQVEDAVLKNRIQGQNEFKVNSTPSFIIGGKLYAGARSFEEMKSLIEPLLPADRRS